MPSSSPCLILPIPPPPTTRQGSARVTKGSAGVNKVIGLTKLRTKYKQYEAKPLNMPYSPSLPPHTTFQTPQGSAGITKVIGLTKLRTKYKQYEAKRQLPGSYDLFLADIDIIHQLPPLIGTKFLKKKKHPIPVKLRGKEWAKSVREACDSTYLYVSGGPSMSVRAARFGMSGGYFGECDGGGGGGGGACAEEMEECELVAYTSHGLARSANLYGGG
ncbi:unnamed protein product [Closterium sp. NIES-65]|nr:unnamed protein product [Closterium sp. NIES-65]